jgi:hypothetical protein
VDNNVPLYSAYIVTRSQGASHYYPSLSWNLSGEIWEQLIQWSLEPFRPVESTKEHFGWGYSSLSVQWQHQILRTVDVTNWAVFLRSASVLHSLVWVSRSGWGANLWSFGHKTCSPKVGLCPPQLKSPSPVVVWTWVVTFYHCATVLPILMWIQNHAAAILKSIISLILALTCDHCIIQCWP